MKVVLTGAAGFIGMAAGLRLLQRGDQVLGLDNLSPYYDVELKQSRLQRLRQHAGFSFVQADVAEPQAMLALFASTAPDAVVHLAAQAGVRHSLENPQAYVDSNLQGFLQVLEGCRKAGVRHLVYASSSSVYGANRALPFAEAQATEQPLSLYAATKKANELMAHAYSHLYGLPCSGLRFFTVYGPWGRPDMALFRFTQAMLQGQPIALYNHGHMQRDFTYIDDVAEAIVRVLDRPPQASAEGPACRVFNVGNQQPASLRDCVACLEQALGCTAQCQLLPMQPGDVTATCASSQALRDWTGFVPATPLAGGVERFVAWYRSYYRV